jgi:transposase InsO family protein
MIEKKEEHGFSNEQIYAVGKISRQGYMKWKIKSKEIAALEGKIDAKIKTVRSKHKRMGSRPLYYAAQISESLNIGINKFENRMSELNLVIRPKKKRIQTTTPIEHQYPNLINGKILTSINEVVVGDITYFYSESQLYYIFSLKDMYSKRILGLHASLDMKKESALVALQQLLDVRKGTSITGMIHHTDAGSQYLSNLYKDELKSHDIQISIAKNCLENGAAEQFNGVVKNDYLSNYQIRNLNHLNKVLQGIKTMINEEKPIAALSYKTPVEFEEYIKGLSKADRPKVTLYDFASGK